MAIKEVLELVGSDVVIKQLNDVKKAGEDSLATFSKPLPELKFPEIKPPDSAPVEEFSGHVVKLKDALHTLRPIMQAAGVQFGEFGAFARLASGSVALLAVALGGAIIVGLAKVAENAARTKGQLDDLFGKPGAGQQAFTALEKQAKQFGSTVEGLAPGLESFQAALNAVDRTAKGFVALKAEDLPGASLAKNADAVAAAYENFIKLLRAGRQTQEDAQKTAKAFFDTLKDGGPVTSAALKALPVGTINELKQALGAAGLTMQAFFAAVDAGSISIDKFQAALLKFTPQAQKAFDEKAIKTFSDELGKLGVTFTQGIPNITAGASALATGFVTVLRGIVQPFVLTIEDISQKILDVIAKARLLSGAFVGPTLEQAGKIAPGALAPFPLPEDAGKAGEAAGTAFNEGFLKTGFISASNSLQQLGAAGANAGAQIAKGIDQASASLQNMRDRAKETGDELQSVVSGSTEFKGRLNQIQVFRPQLAGETTPGEAAGKAAGAKFVEAAQSELTALDIPADVQQNLEQQLATAGTESAQAFSAEFETTVPQILPLFQSIFEQIKAIFSTPIPVNFESGGTGGSLQPVFAGGGMVRGKGSTTSDSILAWLSNREFVVNAKAVSHYGPDFFAALNAMRLPQNFNMGGMARMMAGNRFASGGMVKGNPVVLNIDRKSFNMTAGDDTITQLKRFAVASQLSSTGRKPRWVK